MNRTLRSIGRQQLQAAIVGAATLFGARAAQAQWGGYGQQQGAQLVFEWQGNVDRATQFDINGRNVSVSGVQNAESRGRFVSRGVMPNGNGTLYVQRVSGRGQVDVIQQPSYNGDGVVRITDPSGGQGFYDIRVYWQPNGGTYGNNGGYYPNSGYPNGGYGNDGYDRGRDGRYSRDGEVSRERNDVVRDRNGNAVYDRRGNPVYERRGNKVVARDRNGNVIFDRNGNPVYERTDNGRWHR